MEIVTITNGIDIVDIPKADLEYFEADGWVDVNKQPSAPSELELTAIELAETKAALESEKARADNAEAEKQAADQNAKAQITEYKNRIQELETALTDTNQKLEAAEKQLTPKKTNK